jgi:predicted transcriptional regulator
MMGAQAGVPANLPADITRSQFIVLRHYRQGMKNSNDIGKALSMDNGAVDSETSSLTSNGYLTKDRKLTTKALEVLGA